MAPIATTTRKNATTLMLVGMTASTRGKKMFIGGALYEQPAT